MRRLILMTSPPNARAEHTKLDVQIHYPATSTSLASPNEFKRALYGYVLRVLLWNAIRITQNVYQPFMP